MTVDLGDVRLARNAEGLLGVFNSAGVLDPADVHVAARVGRLGGEHDEGDELVDVSALPWPDPPRWLAACAASGIVSNGADAPGGLPLRLVDGLLYLERYWGEEELVRRSLAERAAVAPPEVDLPRLSAGLARHFGEPGSER